MPAITASTAGEMTDTRRHSSLAPTCGQMNLDLRYIQGFQGVVQGVRVVGPGTGVYDEPV